MDVKSALAREMRGIEGLKVMPVESRWVRVLPMQWLKGAYARSLTAYAECVHNTTLCIWQRDLSWLGLWSSLDT